MQLTEDSFRALANSSPWRWRTLHFTRTDSGRANSPVEAWVRRPGEQVTRQDGRTSVFREADPNAGRTWISTDPGYTPPRIRWPHEVEPNRRPDGLVAERPNDWTVSYAQPIHGNYTWVAMLDPVELSHHVSVADLVANQRHGRETWWAEVRAEEGYQPTCGCCALLWSDISERDEGAIGGPTYAESHPDVDYPDAWLCGLDLETGVLVSLTAIGGDGLRSDLGFEVEIHEIDGDVDHAFVQ